MILNRSVIAYLIVITVTAADAQPVGTEAEVLYDKGRDLIAAGNIAGACDAFVRSYRLDRAITTIIALATCREKLGQLANARALFLMAEQRTLSESDDVTIQLHTIARDRAAKLEPRVPKLTIQVPDQSKIDGLEILRATLSRPGGNDGFEPLHNAVNIPAAMWNRAIPIDGGTYTITARAPGAKDWSMTVTLAAEADAKTVDIPDLRKGKSILEEPAKVATVNEPAAKPRIMPPTPDVSGSGQRESLFEASTAIRPRRHVAPIAVGAGAVLLLGGALRLSMWADSTYNDAEAEITDQARRDSLYDSANHKRYAAQGLAVAGVGGAVIAAWLYLRPRGTRAEQTSRAGRLLLAPSPAGIGVAGQF